MALPSAATLTLFLMLAVNQDLAFHDVEIPSNLFQRALIVDDEDRQTESEYAASHGISIDEVRNRFGATGHLRCPNAFGSAQVTLRNNILTTAAYVFMNTVTGETENKAASRCAFELPGRPPMTIKRMIEMGYSRAGPRDNEDDWAILELDKPVIDVHPYKLPANRKFPVRLNDKVFAVGTGESDFFRYDNRGHVIHPKSISDCLAKGGEAGKAGNAGMIATDCDIGAGGSGGSLLKSSPEGGYELVGILMGSTEDWQDSNRAVERHVPNRCRLHLGTCETYATAVSGRLYETLTKLQ